MQLPLGDRQTAKLHREWLAALVAQTGIPLTRLAQEIGISPSTLTRPAREGDKGTSTLHAATIQKIVSYTGIAGPGVAETAGVRRPRGLAEEAIAFESEDAGLKAAVRAMIAGRNGVDPWALKTRALEGAGYLPGDIVLMDMNAHAQPGEAVCAQVYDWSGGKAETVWRIYDPPVLLGVPFEPAARPKPLIVDNDRVVIKGVVAGMVRPRLRPAA